MHLFLAQTTYDFHATATSVVIRSGPMQVATAIFYDVFGLITLIGGIQAFVSVKSKASLIAGGISGLLLLLAGGYNFRHPIHLLGLVVCLALAGRFLPKFFKEKKWWPAGVEGWLGLVGVVLTVISFVSVMQSVKSLDVQ